MLEQDYCRYIISKCENKACGRATNGLFNSTTVFLERYEKSSIRNLGPLYKKRIIIKYINELLCRISIKKEDSEDIFQLKNYCLERIKFKIGFEELFTILSDCLWIVVSCELLSNQLIVESWRERARVAKWLEGLNSKIKEKEYELSCINEARNLSLLDSFFLGRVKNKDVVYYANMQPIDRDILEDKMQQEVYRDQVMFYASMATLIYRDDLERRMN